MYRIVSLLVTILRLYSWVMVVYCFMSWIPPLRDSRVGAIITDLCEPVLTPIRRKLSRWMSYSMFDFSPMVVFLLIQVLTTLLYWLI